MLLCSHFESNLSSHFNRWRNLVKAHKTTELGLDLKVSNDRDLIFYILQRISTLSIATDKRTKLYLKSLLPIFYTAGEKL